MPETDQEIPKQLSPEEILQLKRHLIDDPGLVLEVSKFMTLEALEDEPVASPRDHAAKAITLGIQQYDSLQRALAMDGDEWPGHDMAGPTSVAAAVNKVEALRALREHHG